MKQVLDEFLGPADTAVETRVTFCQHNLKCNVQEHHFVYFHEVIINFMTCFYFSLALVRSNNSHCQIKESFKEKVHSDNK